MLHIRFAVILATAWLLAASTAAAQSSAGTLKVVYGFAAGDAGDTLARMIAERLGTAFKVPAVVENRGGASGRIGTKAVIGAEPDGMTLLFSPMGPAALHPVSHPNMDTDTFRDLAPVSQAATFDISLTVGPAVPVKSAGEFVAWIKANPDKANYGTPGLGGLPHFFAVMFATSAGIKITNVPYRGGAAVMNDIISGQLPFAFGTTATYVELHKAGRVRVLATSGRERTPFLAGVPTFKEAGYDIEGTGWYAVYAPLKTPSDRIEAISRVIQDMMREPGTRTKVESLGLVPSGTTPSELRRLQVADRERWTPAIRASGFKPTN
jgi:tripartite-type tricarboxylate transporter receptor subunit TctC